MPNHPFFKIITVLFLIAVLVLPAGATLNKTFSIENNVVYNWTATVRNDGATPWWVWLSTLTLGVVLFLYSIQTGREQMNDIAALLSLPFLLLASWQSFAVEVISGWGVTSQPQYLSDGNVTLNYVLMEHHNIHHFDFIGFIFFIWFIVGVANVYRVYATPDRIA